MDKERWIGFIEVMLEAYDQPESERETFIRTRLAGEDTLIEEGLALLAPGRELPVVPEDPLFPLAQLFRGDDDGEHEDLPKTIGRYQVLDRLGEGGMGAVYLARQSEPFKRTLAIKVMRSGLTSVEARARFDLESRVLANMDHPHIAHIIDSGVTEEGQAYFSMEYFPGVSIDKFCLEHDLSLRDRLLLFEKICQGVQHAHQKSIIHRDLKPSNILVMEQDGAPFPKIIDFGIAKALDGHELTENTPNTRVGAVLGTMNYVSPEQADRILSKIDTRSDIYGLGAVLYQLLCGAPPFHVKRFGYDVPFSEQIKIITEEQPPLPSRRIEDKALAKKVRHDLDRIVEKAMSKEPEHRYATASEMAADIHRFLEHKPVLAASYHPIYRIRKFVRRNRTSVLAATAVFFSLLIALLISVTSLAALKNQNMALEKFIEIFIRSFQAAKPDEDGKDVKVLDVLQNVVDDLDHMPNKYTFAMVSLPIGGLLTDYRDLDQAEKVVDRALASRIDVFGAYHLETLKAYMGKGALLIYKEKYQEARLMYDEVLKSRPSRANRFVRLQAQKGKADCLRKEGRNDEAIALYKATEAAQRRSGAAPTDIAETISGLALSYKRSGNLIESKKAFQDTIQIQEQELEGDHSDLLSAKQNYAIVLGELGEYAEQIRVLEEVYELRATKYDSDHERLLATTHSLAGAYYQVGRFEDAEGLAREAWLKRSQKPSLQSRSLSSQELLALILARLGQFEEARSLAYSARNEQESRLGLADPRTCSALVSLAYIEMLAGSHDRVLALLEEGRPAFEAAIAETGSVTLEFDWRTVQAESLMALNQFEEARDILENAKLLVEIDGPETPRYAFCTGLLGYCLINIGEREAGRVMLKESLDTLKVANPGDYQRILSYQNKLDRL